MTTYLPSKDLLLEACAGRVALPHPLLEAAYELASLFEARQSADPAEVIEIDCARAKLVHEVDCWIARELPRPYAAAALHTETVGMVVDRLAQFSVAARTALGAPARECSLHYTWKRLAELSLAYADLSHDLNLRTRRIPDYIAPLLEDLQHQQF
ncbi:DUF4254 domain-containing protein [Nocardia sp. NBC_01503]|uniref:DUF4254 domain-containing protein n=1 Tax=Nocardia sp. NBC_01503 TaxID=2975997 RepID=UPI002E7BED83|nr:DUF4254 domain-containing protein [Nocardia sp. NBC_01503]WTL34204.1 DUF4254 domain-containing protein [Nocardia sp. NBC_01503]